jgi:hypothetical protein
MRFSNCGNYLYGLITNHAREGEPVFLNISRYIDQVPSAITTGSGSSSQIQVRQALTDNKNVAPWKEMNTKVEQTAVQVSGIRGQMPEFTSFQGQLQMSSLIQDNDSGSVMLQTLRTNGEMREEKLVRLPRSLTLEKSYSTLIPAGSHNNLRLVLDKAVQETYSTKEVPDFQLPVVLDRDKSSIPVTTYDPQKRIESSSYGKRVIEHTSDDEAEGSPALKRRRERIAHG